MGRTRMLRFWTGVWIMAMLLNLLTGCDDLLSPDTPGEKPAGTAIGTDVGVLVRVLYETSAGSMVARSDFMIEVTPEEIVRAEYWPEDLSVPDRAEKEHEPIKAAQWANIEKITAELLPVLEEIPEAEPDDEPLTIDGEEIFVLDGGDYWRLQLTWEKDGVERTAWIRNPSDRRITTLDSLLRELADPIGREIVWYDAPVLNGIFFHSEEEDYSFQFTYFESEDNYYFIARYNDADGKTDVSRHVSVDEWPPAGAWFASLGLEDFPSGWSFHDPVTVTLYYSDGRQTTVQPDRDTAAKMADYFVALTAKYR